MYDIQNKANKESFDIWKQVNDNRQRAQENSVKKFCDILVGSGPRKYCMHCGYSFPDSGYYDSSSYCPVCGKQQM